MGRCSLLGLSEFDRFWCRGCSWQLRRWADASGPEVVAAGCLCGPPPPSSLLEAECFPKEIRGQIFSAPKAEQPAVALFGDPVELVDESSAVDHHASITPHPNLQAPQLAVWRWAGHQHEADQ